MIGHTHGSEQNRRTKKNSVGGVVKAALVMGICMLIAGCDDIPSPDAFAFAPTSPMVIEKDGLLVRLQKYTEAQDAELQYGKDFYTQNNSFLLEVVNESTRNITLTPFFDAFIEDMFGRKYSSTSYINMELFSADTMAPGLLCGAIGGGIAGGLKAAAMQSKLFGPFITVQPGETRKGLVMFEKLISGEYGITVIMPKMIADTDAGDRTFLWKYNVTLKEKK